MKSFFVQVEQRPPIQQPLSHRKVKAIRAMGKHSIRMRTGVMVVACALRANERVARILMHATRNRCTTVSTDSFVPNKCTVHLSILLS